MMKQITTGLAAFAVVAIAGFSNQASAQHCSDCNAGSGFGFPVASATSACGGTGGRLRGSHGGRMHEFRNKLDHYSALNSKIAARNDAWPKPFACIDKADYYNIWSQMLAAGTETQCVLDDDFFGENHELNRVGIDRVRGIMANMPSDNRSVYVHRTNDDRVNKARMDAIRNTVDLYYSHKGPVNVALSDHVPRSISGNTVQRVRELRTQNMAPPIIQVGAGESVANSVQN
jgi:hypothetical protein